MSPMGIDKHVNTISPYSVIPRNNDRTTTYSTFPHYVHRKVRLLLLFLFLTLLFICTLSYLLSAKIR